TRTRHIYARCTHFHPASKSKPSTLLTIPNAMDNSATLDFFTNNFFDLSSDSSSFSTFPETYTQSHCINSYLPSSLYSGSPEPQYTFASPETVAECSFEDFPPRRLCHKKS